MTITLGWKHYVAALVLGILITWGIVWYFTSPPPDVVDHERAQQIEKYDTKIRRADERADEWEAVADQAQAKQQEQEQTIAELDAALRTSRRRPRTVKAESEEGQIALELVPLQRDQLKAKDAEIFALRREVVYLKTTREYDLAKDILQDKRLKACKKQNKKQKKRAIIRDVVGGTFVLAAGYGLGRIQ